MKVTPVVLAYETLPDEALNAPFLVALGEVKKFYDAYGKPVEYGELERYAYTGEDYRLVRNPWNLILDYLQREFISNEFYLVLIPDWIGDGVIYGWGGYPMGLMGKYAADKFLTAGTPEAIVDDFLAAGLTAHELGHVMGYAHDDSTFNVMYHWWQWPNINPSPAMTSDGRYASLSSLIESKNEACPVFIGESVD